MNANKRATMRERARRFRRRISGKDRAVSPVVATLILILIAVAAAAALYLWLVVWQGHITSGIGNVGAQPTLIIGGSTSVYPFDELAVTQFEQNYSDVAIENTEGGSGAGMLAVCNGAVNIGAASFPVTPATLVSTYGCSPSVEATIQVQTVAFDAVDVIVPTSNSHGLLSINYDTLAMIYQDASVSAGGHPTLITYHENGVHIPAGIPVATTSVTNTTVSKANPLLWNEVPAAVEGATVGTYVESYQAPGNVTSAPVAHTLTPAQVSDYTATAATHTVTGTFTFVGASNLTAFAIPAADVVANNSSVAGAATVTATYNGAGSWTVDYSIAVSGLTVGGAYSLTVSGFTNKVFSNPNTAIGIGAGVACSGAGLSGDLCATGLETTAPKSPCGFTVCAGGTDVAIDTWARSDASGTTQSFEARLIDAESTTTFATASQLQGATTGFTGCGSSNYISDCGYVATKTGFGNPGVISGVASDANGIGYASDGLARASGSGVGLVSFLGVGQTQGAYQTADPSWYGGILPTTGSTGTIALGIKSSTANAPATDYTTGYLGWRPFDLVTLAAPTGVAAEFFSFVTNSNNNQALATEAQEVSIYSVGAVPGVT